MSRRRGDMSTHPLGSTLRNVIGVRRFENLLVRQALDEIEEAFARITGLLGNLDPTSRMAGHRWRTQDALDKRIDAILTDTYLTLNKDLGLRLVDLGEAQSAFAARTLQRATVGAGVDITPRRLGRAQWRTILTEDPIQGEVWRDWWADQSRKTADRFHRQVQIGLTQNETIDDLVRRVRGRSVGRGRYTGGVMQVSTREAEALVRTGVNQIANRGSYETYKANDDVTSMYEYVATLDSRTTFLCASLDGKRYRYDDPKAPRPPQHFGCRSTLVPVVDWEGLGVKPPPPGQRASADGPVSANLDYAGWLRDQPAAEQDAILGPSRGKLFRAGKVTLSDLVRSDGSTATLKELDAA